MKIKHQEIQIPKDNPFANCKLEMEPYAKVLTKIVVTYADGFVMAINNEWGTGKTTFVKMWQQQLKKEGFKTIYFNAWENDFDSNPLVALMSELETLTNVKNQKVFKSVVEKGAVLVKRMAPALVKSLIKKYIADIDVIAVDAIENATNASTEILEEEIKEYANKKKTIIEFRKELEKFVKQAENPKPLIFIVDELDRCRPSYSVEVLEQIKHFFSVSGIVFVLSIDKKHLGSSINGYYGSESIDSFEYLRRFIDLEFSLPSPNIKKFNKYLYEYYEFNTYFTSADRIIFPEFEKDGENFLAISEILFTKSNATLRQQERVYALSRLILWSSFNSTSYVFPYLLFLLIYLKVMQNDIYKKIEKRKLTLQELSDIFFEITNSSYRETDAGILIFTEALILWLYNNGYDYQGKDIIMKIDELDNITTPIKSKLVNALTAKLTLEECFKYFTREFSIVDYSLNDLINKINLTDSVIK